MYVQLQFTLDTYLALRIDKYIFFRYYKWDWNILNIKLIEFININILKEIYEYDYKVFKTLLFLYWDLEYYLEDIYYVKNSLIVDLSDLDFLRIKFNNKFRSNFDFVNIIKNKESMSLWENMEPRSRYRGMFDEIFIYDIYFWKINKLNVKYNNDINIKKSKLYIKYNDKINLEYIAKVRKFLANNEKIDPLYYENYIEDWYKEWYSEINQDSSLKYWKKIKDLKLEFKNLIMSLDNINE